MKRFLFFLLLVVSINSNGQAFRVDVVNPDILVCIGARVTFEALITDPINTGAYKYQWLFKGLVITDSTRRLLILPNVQPSDTGYYNCVVLDTSDLRTDTSSRSPLQMRAQLHVDTLYRYNALGCPTDSNGQMKILVSGGNPPYTYVWSGGSFHQLDTLGVGFPRGDYTVSVYDSDTSHCVIRQFKIETLKLHKVTFKMNPPDTVYLTNPLVTFTIPDTTVQHLANWTWDFGDNTPTAPKVNPATHNYAKTGTFYPKLNFTDNINGQLCDSAIVDTITVKTIHLFVPNVITPGSGDDNSALNIRESDPSGTKPQGSNLNLSEVFLSNKMVIINRQGKRVYEKSNYQSGDWDGDNLAPGVYYYFLECHGENSDEVYKGAITILRH